MRLNFLLAGSLQYQPEPATSPRSVVDAERAYNLDDCFPILTPNDLVRLWEKWQTVFATIGKLMCMHNILTTFNRGRPCQAFLFCSPVETLVSSFLLYCLKQALFFCVYNSRRLHSMVASNKLPSKSERLKLFHWLNWVSLSCCLNWDTLQQVRARTERDSTSKLSTSAQGKHWIELLGCWTNRTLMKMKSIMLQHGNNLKSRTKKNQSTIKNTYHHPGSYVEDLILSHGPHFIGKNLNFKFLLKLASYTRVPPAIPTGYRRGRLNLFTYRSSTRAHRPIDKSRQPTKN